MGLDMYVRTMTKRPDKVVDFTIPEDASKLFYWRKHPDLHGWMEQRYFDKGGKDRDFNVAPMVLDKGDIDDLEKAVTADELPHTEGFFFGVSYPEDKAATLEFITKARKAIEDGLTIFYYAWW